MRVVEMTGNRLVVRDRAVVPTLAVLIIALIWAVLGLGAYTQGDDTTTRMGGAAFAIGAVPLVILALFLARTHRMTFDRRRGVLTRRVSGLARATEELDIPLARVRYAEIEVKREVADP
ncbi:MAG: hypothetical protein AAFU70_14570, partial [Planctomycetota bacterium]